MATPYGAFRALVDEIGAQQAEEDLRALNIAWAAQCGGDGAKRLADDLRDKAFPQAAWWRAPAPSREELDAFFARAREVQKRACRQRGGGS